jgi:Uma2 family endonuclease
MPGEAAEKLWTADEFLAMPEDETGRHFELVNGRIVAMAPPLLGHGAIVVNLCALLSAGVRPPGRAYLLAGIRPEMRNDCVYVVDMAVSCQPQGSGARWVEDPVLLVEVLSPNSRMHDRGQKVPDCADIPSVREILLIDASRRHVTLWSRQAEGWLVCDFIGDSSLPLSCLDAPLPLDAVYNGVTF